MPELWIPETAREAQARFLCRICEHRFETYAVYERHVVKCGQDNEDLIHEAVEERRNHPMYAPIDPEWSNYNEQLRAQGLNPEVQYRRPRKSAKRIGET